MRGFAGAVALAFVLIAWLAHLSFEAANVMQQAVQALWTISLLLAGGVIAFALSLFARPPKAEREVRKPVRINNDGPWTR